MLSQERRIENGLAPRQFYWSQGIANNLDVDVTAGYNVASVIEVVVEFVGAHIYRAKYDTRVAFEVFCFRDSGIVASIAAGGVPGEVKVIVY